VNKVVSEFNSNGTFTQQITGGVVIRSLRRKDQYNQVTETPESIKTNGKSQ